MGALSALDDCGLVIRQSFSEALAVAPPHGVRLMAYWQSLIPDGGGLPRRDALDPAKIVDILPNFALMERTDPATILVRLIGTASVNRIGFDPTGRNILDIHVYSNRERLRRQLSLLLDRPCGQIIAVRQTYTSGRDLDLDICRLPLADRSGEPRFIALVACMRDYHRLEFQRARPEIRSDMLESTFFDLP